jgi:hypothetical protein
MSGRWPLGDESHLPRAVAHGRAVGTGLGLAMVYGVAQRPVAEVEIERTPGQGTTVQSPPAPQRVLIVDDGPLILKSLQDVLTADRR